MAGALAVPSNHICIARQKPHYLSLLVSQDCRKYRYSGLISRSQFYDLHAFVPDGILSLLDVANGDGLNDETQKIMVSF